MKPTVILFGASRAGIAALEALKPRVRVLAFADNDPQKHGTTIAGIPVIPPASIPGRKYDGVIISSMYSEQIHTQLLALGLPPEIIFVHGSNRQDSRPAFPWDAVLFLCLCTGVILALLTYLLLRLCAG